jgi:hypothetical protein
VSIRTVRGRVDHDDLASVIDGVDDLIVAAAATPPADRAHAGRPSPSKSTALALDLYRDDMRARSSDMDAK